MDKTGSTSTLVPKTVRRNFFQWAVKWFYGNLPENTAKKSDIPSIICLLQAAGFKLREFDKRNPLVSSNDDEVKTNNIRITMECGSSKMTAVLEMEDVTCECRDNNEVNEGSLWSVTGTGPMASTDNVNKFEETGSSLLPEMSKETTTVVRDVVHRLLKVINNTCEDDCPVDFNANSPIPVENTANTKSTDAKDGLVRSYTDFYGHKSRTVANMNSNLANSKCMSSSKSIKDSGTLNKPKLRRQGTYELDNESMEEPRPSPPKVASSPVHAALCSSLDQLSLQSDDADSQSLADYIVKAYNILDKAMKMICKMPIIQVPDDVHFVKPIPPPLMSNSFCAGSPSSTRARTNGLNSRTISNASTRSTSSTASSGSRVSSVSAGANKSMIAQKTTFTSRTSAVPPMRDRSSSLSAAQRPAPSSLKTLASQRRSANAVSTLALTPRPASANSKLPTTKPLQSRGLFTERTVSQAKSHISSPAVPSQARNNTSFIKVPSTTTRPSASAKFGYNAKK